MEVSQLIAGFIQILRFELIHCLFLDAELLFVPSILEVDDPLSRKLALFQKVVALLDLRVDSFTGLHAARSVPWHENSSKLHLKD